VQGHLGNLGGCRQACVTLAAPCQARRVRLAMFMTRVYDLQRDIVWAVLGHAVKGALSVVTWVTRESLNMLALHSPRHAELAECV
jgi:ABC-type uncharacterized transport system YnjBCD permease subunit